MNTELLTTAKALPLPDRIELAEALWDSLTEEQRRYLEGFVSGIRAERFAPSPSADCQWCRFKTLCPVWPEGDDRTGAAAAE